MLFLTKAYRAIRIMIVVAPVAWRVFKAVRSFMRSGTGQAKR